jgi:hypothetical protein
VAGIALVACRAVGAGRWRAAGRLKQLVAIYGTGDLAERLVERLRVACPETIDIVGVFDDRAGRGVIGSGLRELPHGTTAELVELSRQFEIDRIVVALPHSAEQRLLEILRKLHKMPVEISLAPDMVGFHVPAKDHEEFGGLPLLDVYGGRSLRPDPGQDRVRPARGRARDRRPVAGAARRRAAIKLDSKGPVLFRQNRYGFGDRVIQVYKFRTMKADVADTNGEKQTETQRPAHHPDRRVPAALEPRRIAPAVQCAARRAVAGRPAPARGQHARQAAPQRGHRARLRAAPSRQAGDHRLGQVNGYHGPVETERRCTSASPTISTTSTTGRCGSTSDHPEDAADRVRPPPRLLCERGRAPRYLRASPVDGVGDSLNSDGGSGSRKPY